MNFTLNQDDFAFPEPIWVEPPAVVRSSWWMLLASSDPNARNTDIKKICSKKRPHRNSLTSTLGCCIPVPWLQESPRKSSNYDLFTFSSLRTQKEKPIFTLWQTFSSYSYAK
uniref:(northern house mosquito) hypothetical protein n=1 Tax=Culex pipiens TaxID=7175 RepID=A0A8D8PE56_CULPI